MKNKRVIISSVFALLMLTLFLIFSNPRKGKTIYSLEIKPTGHPLR